jgi:hypothetical protein
MSIARTCAAPGFKVFVGRCGAPPHLPSQTAGHRPAPQESVFAGRRAAGFAQARAAARPSAGMRASAVPSAARALAMS